MIRFNLLNRNFMETKKLVKLMSKLSNKLSNQAFFSYRVVTLIIYVACLWQISLTPWSSPPVYLKVSLYMVSIRIRKFDILQTL